MNLSPGISTINYRHPANVFALAGQESNLCLKTNQPMLLSLLTNEIRYRGYIRLLFHALMLAGIGTLVGIFYLSWFGQGGFTIGTWAPYLREVAGVAMQYYMLVWLFRNVGTRLIFLLPGLLAYYWLTYTYYFVTAIQVYHYTNVDDFSGAAYHFIQHKDQYWQTLFSFNTLMRLVRFPMLMTLFPLLLWAGVEAYRRQILHTQLEYNYLKSQVNPHFLFNVLNSIYALTEEENPRAAQIVQQLSGMMRYTLYETSEALVPLTRELDFIRDYVALEKLRTGKRLSLTIELLDTIDKPLQIAPFILITFVENAFKHGVENTTKKALVTISVQLQNERLHLHVSNSKPQTQKSTTNGLGLANVRKRLTMLYPGRYSLQVNDTDSAYSVDLYIQLRSLSLPTSSKATATENPLLFNK
ncbi:sensor histidine kinase [Spirosoma endbachense]|nr:histidine kinase [Spirosoma endbachense]